jgi:hypothetical protein
VSVARPTAGRPEPGQRGYPRCWAWELRDGVTLIAHGREPSRDKALVMLRQRVRECGTPAAALEARLIYFMPGGVARERVQIAGLLAGELTPRKVSA